MGPKGHGKTTLLEALEARLEGAGVTVHRLRLRREGSRVVMGTMPRPADTDCEQTLTLDGLDLLRPWTWWRVRRSWRRHGILATSHRLGRLPTLAVHHTSPELLRALVAELLRLEGMDDRMSGIEPRLDALFERHHGNVRECLRELYDALAA